MAAPSGDDVQNSAASQFASIIDHFDAHLAPHIDIATAHALSQASQRFVPFARKIVAFRSLFDPLIPAGRFPDLFAQCRALDAPARSAMDAGEFLLHRQIVFVNRLLDHHDAIPNVNKALERAVVNWGVPGGLVLGTVLRHATDLFHFTAEHRQVAVDVLEHLLSCNIHFSEYDDACEVIEKGLELLDRAGPHDEMYGGERYDVNDDITKRALHLVDEKAPEHARFVRLAVSRRPWQVVATHGVRFLRFYVEHGGDINAVNDGDDDIRNVGGGRPIVLPKLLQDRKALADIVNLGADALLWFQEHWWLAYDYYPDPTLTPAAIVRPLKHEFDAVALTRIIYTEYFKDGIRGADPQGDGGWLESIFNTVVSSTMPVATFARQASRWLPIEQMPVADVIFLIKHLGAEIVDDEDVKWSGGDFMSRFVLDVVTSREYYPVMDALVANAGRPAVSRLLKKHLDEHLLQRGRRGWFSKFPRLAEFLGRPALSAILDRSRSPDLDSLAHLVLDSWRGSDDDVVYEPLLDELLSRDGGPEEFVTGSAVCRAFETKNVNALHKLFSVLDVGFRLQALNKCPIYGLVMKYGPIVNWENFDARVADFLRTFVPANFYAQLSKFVDGQLSESAALLHQTSTIA
ncbi:Nuclear pore complex protein Nup85 [Plasmodiophora brassicae]|uniref:Uncharacterized protein n=1 Tax=Plasmodiophora brassicae TaxID=37360 RepID=A0A3P3Y2V8_PLABS|nr:unnamed protein product [Plasmodiophora brassicae]